MAQDDPEEKLKGKLGAQFEERVAQKISEFGGLLTRGAAVRLLCKQNGIDTEKRLALRETCGARLPFSCQARVDRIFPVQDYQNGTDRSVRLHISDSSGDATLILWNEQIALVDGNVSVGDTIECRGAYARGDEIGIGRGGQVKKASSFPVTPIARLSRGKCNVEGNVAEVEPDYHYVDKGTGEEKALSSFLLCQGKDCRRVVVWPSQFRTHRPSAGDSLLLENVLFKNGELHFGSYSRMVKAGAPAEPAGKIERVVASDDGAVFVIGGREFQLGMKAALALVGIKTVPEGVSPATLLSIKAQEIAGKKARYRLEDGKLAWLSFP